MCLVSDLPVDVIVTCGFTLCVIQVTEHGVDVMVMCGFTLCVIQVTECGVDVMVMCGFTLCDSGDRTWCGCDCDVWFYSLCDSGRGRASLPPGVFPVSEVSVLHRGW